MRTIGLVVLMALTLVVAVTVTADEVHGTVTAGYFGDTSGYTAPTLEVASGDWWVYAETAQTYDPDFNLLMVRKTVSEHLKLGVRYQSPGWWRPMALWSA
jgi:hypothetical protein